MEPNPDAFIASPDGTVTPPVGRAPRKKYSAGRKRALAAASGRALKRTSGGGLGSLLKMGGTAMGALNGVGGAAFGVMGLLQLLEMLGSGGGAQGDRESDMTGAQQFLQDPMLEEETHQMATRQGLNSRLNVTGGIPDPGGGYPDGDMAFLDEMEARHGARMQEHMRRTPATMAEIAAVAGLM